MSQQNDLTKQELLATLDAGNDFVAAKPARETALSAIEKQNFPTRSEEAWRKTDVRPILRHRYKKAPVVKVPAETINMYTIENLDADTLVFINGHFAQEHSSVQAAEQGFFAGTMQEAKAKFENTFENYFSKTGFEDENIFASVNSAYAEDGFCVILPNNFVAEKPIRVMNFIDGNDQKVLVQNRNLIVAEENSQAKIICSYHSLSTNYTLNNVSTDVFVKQNANVNLNVFQGEGDDAFHISNTQILQEKNSVFTQNLYTLCGAIVRNGVSVSRNNR